MAEELDQEQEQQPVRCTETELHDVKNKDSAVQCRLVGEHEQHEGITPKGGVLRWPAKKAAAPAQ